MADTGHGTRAADQATGVLLVALAALGWSLAGLFTRLVGADAWAVIGWRGVFGTVAVLAFVALRRGRSGRLAEVVRPGRTGLALATLSTLATVLYIPSLRLTSVANVVVLYATSPFVTAGLALLLLRERPPRGTLPAAAVALAGVAVTAAGATGAVRAGGHDAAGLLLAAGMTVSLALVSVLSRRAAAVSMIPATALSAMQLALVGAAMTPLGAVPAREVAILAVFGLVQAACLAAYVEGARRLPAARAALLSALDVPLAPLWVWLAVGEVPAVATLLGGTLVLGAVLWDIRAQAGR